MNEISERINTIIEELRMKQDLMGVMFDLVIDNADKEDVANRVMDIIKYDYRG